MEEKGNMICTVPVQEVQMGGPEEYRQSSQGICVKMKLYLRDFV